MKTQKAKNKLTVHRDTIRQLDVTELTYVRGGDSEATCQPTTTKLGVTQTTLTCPPG